MGRTIVEKIFDRHRLDTPFADVHVIRLDVVACHEITTPIAINDLVSRGKDRVPVDVARRLPLLPIALITRQMRRRLFEDLQNLSHDAQARPLAVAAEVVHPSGPATVGRRHQPPAVVPNMNPIPNVQTVPVHRERAVLKRPGDREQR